MADQMPSTRVSRYGFWVLWLTWTVTGLPGGLAQRYLPFTAAAAIALISYLAVAELGVWIAGGRIDVVPLVLAPIGGLLAYAAFYVSSLVLGSVILRTGFGPSDINLLADWPSFVFSLPLLVALGFGSVLTLIGVRDPAQPRRLWHAMFAGAGIVYAGAVMIAWLGVGLVSSPGGEAAHAADTYTNAVWSWATQYPVYGLGAALFVSVWMLFRDSSALSRDVTDVPGGAGSPPTEPALQPGAPKVAHNAR